MRSTDVVTSRLLDRLHDGVIVPFLGAGVSNRATSRNPDPKGESFAYDPQVTAMVARLAKSLLNDLKPNTPSAMALRALLLPASTTVVPPWWSLPACHIRPTLDQIIASAPSDDALATYLALLTGNRLERWTEAYVATRGTLATVRTLRLDRLADLEPQPAHVYIAYLAREGLLREVITSNYDTCIEVALTRTLLPDDRATTLPFRVVDDLEAYRTEGAVSFTGPARRPVLHLYKPNGCAARYRQDERDANPADHESLTAAAERLVLTERQLQSFRTGRWAEDLLRDRSRSRALLFSGFGSDEPQVRHTLLTVTREFAAARPRRVEEPDAPLGCWDYPNAPFMILYEPDLTFTQHQVMRGYAEGHCEIRHLPDDPPHALDRWISNVIGGDDIPWFSDNPGADPRLGADLFWQRVFQATFLRLVARAAGPGGELRRWLVDEHVEAPAIVAGLLTTWLGAAVRIDATTRTTWYGRYPALLEESDQAGDLLTKLDKATNATANPVVRPLVLSLWLLAVHGLMQDWLDAHKDDGTPSHVGPGHPYFALRDDGLMVLVTLLMVAVLLEGGPELASLQSHELDGAPRRAGTVHAVAGMGLRIGVAHSTYVYLVADTHPGDPDSLDDHPDDVRQRVLQIVVPSRHRLVVDARVRPPVDIAHGTLTPIRAARIERIEAAALVRASGALSRAEIIRRWAEHRLSPTRATVENLR